LNSALAGLLYAARLGSVRGDNALAQRITYYTTMAGAQAACAAIRHLQDLVPYDLQRLHATL
jgi:hypothetical protein